MDEKFRAPRNRTLTLSAAELQLYQPKLLKLTGAIAPEFLHNQTLNQDLFEILDWLPTGFVDLLFIDPPYNLTKSFGAESFQGRSLSEYQLWLESWLPRLLKCTEAHRFGLHLRRLAIGCGYSSSRRKVFNRSQLHHLGTREGQRRKSQLEKLRRAYLVLYGWRSLHV